MTHAESVLVAVREYLGLEDLVESDRFDEDLGFDSIAMYELYAALEDLSGRELPTEVFDGVKTVGDFVSLAVEVLGESES